MTTNTILLLLLSLVIAGGLSYFQYFFKAKSYSKVNMLLAFLRFLAIFGLLILLINPVITKNSLEVTKTPLAIAVDNSSSIASLKSDKKVAELYQKLISHPALQDKFEIQSYQFDSEFKSSEKFDFKVTIELELSTAIAKGVLVISREFLVIIGFINKSNNPKMAKKRKKAKNQITLDLFLALKKY